MNHQNQFLLALLAFNLFTFASIVLINDIYQPRVLGVTSENQIKISGITNFNQLFKNFQKQGVGQSNNSLKLENFEKLNQAEKLQQIEKLMPLMTEWQQKLLPTMTALTQQFPNDTKGQVPCQILKPVVEQYCSQNSSSN